MGSRLKPNAGPSPRYCGVCGGKLADMRSNTCVNGTAHTPEPDMIAPPTTETTDGGWPADGARSAGRGDRPPDSTTMRLSALTLPPSWKLTITYPAPPDEIFVGERRVAIVIEDDTGKYSGEIRTSPEDYDSDAGSLQEFIDMIVDGRASDEPPPLRLLP